jgi:hypothetical protein
VVNRILEVTLADGGLGGMSLTETPVAEACRFYQKMGCTLGAIDRFAYPRLPGEVQLLWWKALQAPGKSKSG